jgi:tripartite-type tricarboxylate transporter receptor subunit TctC
MPATVTPVHSTEERAMAVYRRSFSGAAALIVLLAAAWPAPAAEYPARPVNLITPAPAGSGPDVIARLVADRLGKRWGQQIVILNRPGAGGLIGVQAAAGAKPDGYALYMPLSSTFIVLPETHPKLPLDLLHDIVPIGLIGEQPMAVAVNSKLGVDTLSGLMALAEKRPGGVLYGANLGGLPNLTGELLRQRTGIKLEFVPYPNTAKATQDATAGTVQVAIESLSGLAGPIRSGMLKPLAVASARRVPDFPDLPTVAEAIPNLKAFEARGWFALTAPSGTPDAIVHKISVDLREVLAQPDLQKQFASLGTYVRPTSPVETAAFIRNEQALWRPLVRQIMVATH